MQYRDRLLIHLYWVCQLKRSDALLFMRVMCSDAYYGSSVLRGVQKDGLVDEATVSKTSRELKNSSDKITRVLYLTNKGRAYLDDKYGYSMKTPPRQREFRTNDTEKLHKALGQSTIMTMFCLAGVKVYQDEKPNIKDIVRVHRATQVAHSTRANYYYTSAEYREVMESTICNSDILSSTTFRGIYVSDDKILVVYISYTGDNRMVRTGIAGETRLLNSLQMNFGNTLAYRALPSISKKTITETGSWITTETLRAEPYALVISDGNALVYSMATGFRKGKVKTYKQKDNFRTYANLLSCNNENYRRIFVTPSTSYGVSALEYLCHTSIEEYIDSMTDFAVGRGNKVFKLLNDFSKPLYRLANKIGLPVCYMPVFEVKELNKIAKSTDIAILTSPDMLDAISHSIMKDVPLYNMGYDNDEMVLFKQDEYFIYAPTGNIRGQELLIQELHNRGLHINYKQLLNLYKLSTTNKYVFWNSVSGDNVKELADLCIEQHLTEEYVEPNKKYHTSTIVSLSCSTTFKKMLLQAADKKGTTLSRYIVNSIYDVVKKDINND